MPQKEAGSAAYLQVRRYVINLIYQAGSRTVRLPSIQELSKQFGITPPTVCKALKALSEQGYIEGKRGIGSFTRPAKNQLNLCGLEQQTVIGLLLGDGMLIHYDAYTAGILAALLKAATRELGAIVHIVPLTVWDAPKIRKMIAMEQLDGLIAYQPTEEILTALRDLPKLPRVIGDPDPPAEDFDVVRLDFEEFGYQCGKRMAEEKRQRAAFLLNRPPWDRQLEGIRRAFAEAGMAMDESLIFRDPAVALPELLQSAARGAELDAVYCPVSGPESIGSKLVKAAPALEQHCLLIESGDCRQKETHFARVLRKVPYDAYAGTLARLLKERMANPGSPCRSVRISVEMKDER